MNTIFIKEVTSSIMGKNIVKLDLVNIGEDKNILELNINSKKIADISSYIDEINNINVITKHSNLLNKFKNIKKQIDLNKFNRQLKSNIKKHNLDGYLAVFSNELKKKNIKEYIVNILSDFSINEYLCLNSFNQNYLKYIEEYILNESVKKEKINILLLANNVSSIDFDIINKLNSEYKNICIFSIEKVSKSFQNKITKINEETGSCVQILNKNVKDFRAHNVYIFIDKSRAEYLKYKFNKKGCYIDFTNKENDKFNQKYLMLENEVKNNKYKSSKIKELFELYGKNTVSNNIID